MSRFWSLAAVLAAGGAAAAQQPVAMKVPAPELQGVTDWVNSKPLKLADQRGKVVVLHFWTHGCINCVHNYPHYKSWAEKFKDKDFVMVGVHTPEFDAEKDVDRIRAKAKEN